MGLCLLEDADAPFRPGKGTPGNTSNETPLGDEVEIWRYGSLTTSFSLVGILSPTNFGMKCERHRENGKHIEIP